jgi:hypothetical protein
MLISFLVLLHCTYADEDIGVSELILPLFSGLKFVK